MTQGRISNANNSICDANILTEDGMHQIKILLCSSTKRSIFVQKREVKSPVQLLLLVLKVK